jgi:RNA polymerase sigma factor (sigma-70 family)
MIHIDLFEKCRQNDARAQLALYNLYKTRLMGLCRRYARSRDDAKDMLQEAFIKIFTKMHQVEAADKLEGWMKSIAIRTAINHYHKMKRMDQVYSTKEYDLPGLDYELVLDNLSDEYLVMIINALPEGCRMVFNLFEVEGYSHTEIAELLGVTEGTSRSQLHHAKYLLKQKLNQVGIKRYEKLA